MAEDTDQRIDCALENIVNATNQSKYVKSEFKKSIMEAVSTLRNIFDALKKDRADKSVKYYIILYYIILYYIILYYIILYYIVLFLFLYT